jgi:hypothetical protein
VQRVVYTLMGVGVLIMIGGCAATTVGVGASAVPGKYVYITGELQATYGIPIDQLWPKTLAVLQELRLTVDATHRDTQSGEIEARRADGTPVQVRLKAVGEHSTTLGIRVGTLGNREHAEYVHRTLQAQLAG